VAVVDDIGHVLNHALIVTAERQVIDALFSDHDELSQIDRVGAFAQDLTLRSALTAVG
jgi:hypothetical protein